MSRTHGGSHPGTHDCCVHNTTNSNTAMPKWRHPAIPMAAYYQTLRTYNLQKYLKGSIEKNVLSRLVDFGR